MAIKVKDRKVLSLSEFRGLDKENKAIKVAPFRAVDGHNFIIDSGTLKTRPGINLKKYINLGKDVKIIDFYLYKDIWVYATNRGLFFEYNGIVLKSTGSPKYISNVFDVMDYSIYTPTFQEEKEVLFIFGGRGILVVAPFYNEDGLQYIYLYPINSKPINTFNAETEKTLYEAFENLPTPYEPTLFVGDNMLDDVNLLSNISKYKVFSSGGEKGQESIIRKVLPTHYDEAKHGMIKEVKVSFYDDLFEEFGLYPVFLGKENEDFEDLGSYGSVFNTDNPIKVEKGFEAKNPFQFKGEKDNSPELIEGILDLTKERFFEMKIKDSSQRVFEFILNYIKNNKDELLDEEENLVLHFTLPYERTSYYRDDTTNDIILVEKEPNNEEDIYVQLRAFADDINDLYFLEEAKESSKVNVYDIGEPFIDYPPFIADSEFEINDGSPVLKRNFNIDSINEITKSFLFQKNIDGSLDSLNEGETFVIKGKIYDEKSYLRERNLNLNNNSSTWLYSEKVEMNYNRDNFPLYPSFSNPSSLPVFEMQGYFITNEKNFPILVLLQDTKEALLNIIIDAINNNGFNEDFENGFFKFRYIQVLEVNPGDFREYGQSVVVDFEYFKEMMIAYQIRQSFIRKYVVLEESSSLSLMVYKIRYSKIEGAFVLEHKDFFFDYNKEPAIDVRIEFEKNEDYKLISESKFGINFGSENRLFLAGNEKYPNIDRYNVSNDLLGDNIKNQSYELSYFPSKNYRVLGGKGAISGYVVATDTQLYITKKDYPNDSKLYIRNRVMDDNGIVGYNEFKTNISKTPINENTLVRFYNDILILDEKGLFGVEISSNVLTNERLLKLRSGFINEDLIKTIKESEHQPYIFEDDEYMYIAIGNIVYVADSRYVAQNPNSQVENYSYEIIKWIMPINISKIKNINDDVYILNNNGLYVFNESGIDEVSIYEETFIQDIPILNNENTSFLNDNILDFFNSDKTLKFKDNAYRVLGKEVYDFEANLILDVDEVIDEFKIKGINVIDDSEIEIGFIEKEDLKNLSIYVNKNMYVNTGLVLEPSQVYTFFDGVFPEVIITYLGNDILKIRNEDGKTYLKIYDSNLYNKNIEIVLNEIWNISILDVFKFRGIEKLDKLFFKTYDGFIPLSFHFIDDYVFQMKGLYSQNEDEYLFEDITNKILYPYIFFEDDDVLKMTLSPIMKTKVMLEKENGETRQEFLDRVSNYDEKDIYAFDKMGMKNVFVNEEKLIQTKWVSAILDFGNNFVEKTLFKTNLYATKQKKENTIKIGFRTMRRYKRFEDDNEQQMLNVIDASNPLDFDEVNFNLFAINTMSEFGSSIPTKENNFLYLQVMVIGEGNIEINSIEMLFKNNRLLKTIG